MQLGRFLSQLVRGNLGQSYIYNVPAASLIGGRIGQTAALVAVATIFAVIFTVPLSALAASRQNGVADHVVRALSVVGLALPAFWFGIVLIEVFAVHLHLLPVGGAGNGFGGHLKALVLPALTASFAMAPILVRSLRVGMLEVMDAEFIAVARAKGLGELRVLFAHVARNALVPTVTLLGLNIAYLIGSTVIVEQVFNLNGLGSLLVELDIEPGLPGRPGHHAGARRRCRARQPGHRPPRRPPRPPDQVAMTTLSGLDGPPPAPGGVPVAVAGKRPRSSWPTGRGTARR